MTNVQLSQEKRIFKEIFYENTFLSNSCAMRSQQIKKTSRLNKNSDRKDIVLFIFNDQ